MTKQVYTGKKVVDVHSDVVCYTPFSGPFKGSAFNQIIPTGSIRYLLSRGAKVIEKLSDGTEVSLDLKNYNLWLDDGEMPSPGYEPSIPQERVKIEKEEKVVAKPIVPEPVREEEPEPIIEPEKERGIEIREEDTIFESFEDEEDVLDNIPEGLTEEEEDQWLEDNLK